ncbi:MTRF1 family protein [Megaselia abdita]
MFRKVVSSLTPKSLSVGNFSKLTRLLSTQIQLQDDKVSTFLESLRQEFYDKRTTGDTNDFTRISKLSDLVNCVETRKVLLKNLDHLKEMERDEKDEDMKQLAREEQEVYSELLQKTERELIEEMMTLSTVENWSSMTLEINAGVGGQEAMLFAMELLEMYSNFLQVKGWDFEVTEEERTDIGGVRRASIVVNSRDAFEFLRLEAGVHRVQRVPETEKSGRIHTSTATVAVIPRPDDIQIDIKEADLKVETKRASGAGGQHVNTTDSAVRIVHLPSGISIECQTERSQPKNKEIAIRKLKEKLFQQQYEAQVAATQATRKSQKGSSNRNEKIRTYNFVQDRVTDHRLENGGTVHNLKDFIVGGDGMIAMNTRLVEENRFRELWDLIEDSCNKK